MNQDSKTPAKRVDIVRVKMVKETSIKYPNRKITCPKDAVELACNFLSDSDREIMLVICLDVKCQPTVINICSIGSLNASIVHPREIFKAAILSNASSIIIAHNHPSGYPSPSNEDISITKRIQECGILLGINLTDHIVIGATGHFVSLKEEGYIP